MTLPPITSTPLPPQRSDAPRPMFSALAIASSGLSAQRMRMEVIAQNLANAETTRTTQGGPYQRRVVNLEAVNPQGDSATTGTSTSSIAPQPGTGPASATAPSATTTGTSTGAATNDATLVDGGVRVASVGEDKTQGALVYDPGHPDADKNGYVRMPNISITDEMMDLMNARRLYEANATVFQVARAMLHKALDI